MKLVKPTNPYIVNQGFGANSVSVYTESGWKGHTGIDLACEHGQVVTSACDGYVYSTMNRGNSDLNKYRAVFVLYDDGVDAFEVSYGHADDLLVQEGTYVKSGDPVITAGNTGEVFFNGRMITSAEKMAGSTAGTHLHFQVRRVSRVTQLNPKDWRLSNNNGPLFHNGFYYKITDRDNGFAGCVDPTQFMPFSFSKTLKYGSQDIEVLKLQTFLKQQGFFPANTQLVQNFGPVTAEAAKNWQVANGIFDFKDEKNPKKIIWGSKSILAANVKLLSFPQDNL